MTHTIDTTTWLTAGVVGAVLLLLLGPLAILAAVPAAFLTSLVYLVVERDPASRRRGRAWATATGIGLLVEVLLVGLLFVGF